MFENKSEAPYSRAYRTVSSNSGDVVCFARLRGQNCLPLGEKSVPHYVEGMTPDLCDGFVWSLNYQSSQLLLHRSFPDVALITQATR